MAGEIEEPFRFNFQADTLHSGSISFGRFETEALCWERRSSFSHNRYLEEIEKCSKPGLVTAKKAYFEAHFRNRGLLRRSSSEHQNVTEYQSSKNDVSESMGYDEQLEQKDEGNCSPCFDQSSQGSVHDRGDFLASFCELQVEPTSVIANNENDITECGKIEEENQTEFDELVPMSTELETEVEQNVEEEGSCLDTRDMPTTAADLHPDNRVDQENIGARQEKQRGHSGQHFEGRIASEIKHVKPRLTSRGIVPQEKRTAITEASRGSSTKPRVRVNDTNAKSKAEKKTLGRVTQSNRPMHKMPKNEVLQGPKAKATPEIKSAKKELANWKVSTSRPSSSHKSETTARPSANRLTQAVTRGMKQSVSDPNSRSGVLSDRRKEDHMKLEGKACVKQTEINQLRAKLQEKEKSQIKQFSRNLNFKATPMPSFYHRDGQGSDKSKGTASITKSRTPSTKSSIPGNRISERPSSSSSKGANRPLSVSKTLKSTDLPLVSGATSCHSTVTTDSTPSSPGETSNNNRPIKAAVKNTGTGTKKHINIRIHEADGKKK